MFCASCNCSFSFYAILVRLLISAAYYHYYYWCCCIIYCTTAIDMVSISHSISTHFHKCENSSRLIVALETCTEENVIFIVKYTSWRWKNDHLWSVCSALWFVCSASKAKICSFKNLNLKIMNAQKNFTVDAKKCSHAAVFHIVYTIL